MTQREEFEAWFECVGFKIEGTTATQEQFDEFKDCASFIWESAWQAAKAQAVPEGYRLMPPEPTPEMIEAWRESPFSDDPEENLASGYDAMFLAAPEQIKGGE